MISPRDFSAHTFRIACALDILRDQFDWEWLFKKIKINERLSRNDYLKTWLKAV